jgi:hypothetical protein
MKGIIGFVIGAAVGSVASYFVTREIERKKANEQIAAVTDKMNELKENNDILKDVRHKSDTNLEKSYEDIAKVPEGPILANNTVDYAAIANSKKVKAPKSNEDVMIKEIDEQKYYDCVNNKNYGESVFTFYQGDGVLVDEETGMRVSNPEKYVGPNGVDAMKRVSVEEVYYADEKDEIINCITITEDSYYEEAEESYE